MEVKKVKNTAADGIPNPLIDPMVLVAAERVQEIYANLDEMMGNKKYKVVEMERDWMVVNFVIPRDSNEEQTFAVIHSIVNHPDLKQKVNYLAALKRAITAWIQNDELGKEFWNETCHDLNVGDLSTVRFEKHSALSRYLADEGIKGFKVDYYTTDDFSSISWTYDTVLVNKDSLNKH